MIRLTALAAISSLAVMTATPAIAQGAPVYRGSTSSDLASVVTELRQSNAQMSVRISNMEADRAQMTGDVETLRFLLSQTRDEINRMQEDDTQIGELLNEQADQIETLTREVNALKSAIATGETEELDGMVSSRPSTAGDQRPPVTQTRTVTSNDQAPVRYSGDTGMSSDSRQPAQTGSLGQLPASALPGDAGPLFADAKSKLLQFDYAGAEAAFRAFLDRFSDDPQAGEAQYCSSRAPTASLARPTPR